MADITLFQDRAVDLETPISSIICQNTKHMCLETACYCMQMGGDYLADQSVRLLLDMAALCHSSLDTALRVTWLHAHTIATLVATGKKAAAICERFTHDERMMRCAELCRECVAYCGEADPVTA